MVDSYVVHIYRHAHDTPEYVTGHIEVSGSGHQRFFSSYDGLLRVLSDTVTGRADISLMTGQGKRQDGRGQRNSGGASGPA